MVGNSCEAARQKVIIKIKDNGLMTNLTFSFPDIFFAHTNRNAVYTIRKKKLLRKSCGCPAVMEQNNAATKQICCQKSNFFCFIPRSIKYRSNGSHIIVCQMVLNSIHTFAKPEKLKRIAAIIAAGTVSPISTAKRYRNMLPSIGCSMTRIVHAVTWGKI